MSSSASSVYECICVHWKWPKKVYKLQLVLAIVSCFVINMALGLSTSFGNLVPYAMSYIREFSRPSTARMTDSIFLYVVQCFGYTLCIFLGGVLVPLLGPRAVAMLGGVFFIAGIALSYYTIKISLYLFMATYGGLFGIGLGLQFIATIACAVNWLPKWKGIAVSIVTAGFGTGPLIYNGLVTAFVNPHNEPPNYAPDPNFPDEQYFTQPKILTRVQLLFLVLASYAGTLLVISNVFLVNPHPSYFDNNNVNKTLPTVDKTDNKELPNGTCHKPLKDENPTPAVKDEAIEMKKLLPTPLDDSKGIFQKPVTSSDEPNDAKHVTSYTADKDTEDFSPLQMMATASFYLLWIKSMFGCAITAYCFTLYKTFGLEMVTVNDFYVAFVGSMAGVSNLIGRFTFGLLEDLTDHYFVLTLQNGIMTCLLFTCYATAAGGPIMYLVWICAIFFCAGGYFSLYPSAVAKRFGGKNLSVNYGIVNSSCLFGDLITAVVSQWLIHRIKWYGTFFLFGGISFLDLLLSIVYSAINNN